MFADGIGQSTRSPDKHAAVPQIISRVQKFSRFLRVRLFGESTHAKNAVRLFAGLDVSVTSLRTGGLHAHDHDVLAGIRDLKRLVQILAEALFVADYMIGREHADDGLWILTLDHKGSESDSRRGIACCRLGEDLLATQRGELGRDDRLQIVISDYPEIL